MILLFICLCGFIAYLLYLLGKAYYKIGYYEQTLRNYKSIFSQKQWDRIERMINN